MALPFFPDKPETQLPESTDPKVRDYVKKQEQKRSELEARNFLVLEPKTFGQRLATNIVQSLFF